MKRKQFAWAVVYSPHGYIDHSSLKYTRRDLIAAELKEFRGRASPLYKEWGNLTDAQFWRKLKRRHRMRVCRIELKVVR